MWYGGKAFKSLAVRAVQVLRKTFQGPEDVFLVRFVRIKIL
jgi:hypothetical protein